MLEKILVIFSFLFTLRHGGLCSSCLPIVTETSRLGSLTLMVTGTDIELLLSKAEDVILTANLGLSLPSELGQPTPCSDGPICWHWGDAAQLTISPSPPPAFPDGSTLCYDISWSHSGLSEARDCFDIGDAAWFAGCEEHDQHFPLSLDSPRSTYPYLPGDFLVDEEQYFGGVAEAWWLNSKGIGIWVPEGNPLLYSWNEAQSHQMCLSSKYEHPYVKPTGDDSIRLDYKICSGDNARDVQLFGARNFLGLPTGIPDQRMIELPIWSTWAQFKERINESIVLGFATDIRNNGFSDSQLEIDDNWESCYGDATFDLNKFPDAAGMVGLLHGMGFRVTLWIHPFVNMECSTWNEIATFPQGYFVKDPKKGQSLQLLQNLPGMTSWWQGNLAGYVDFTNPRAVEWWKTRLDQLKSTIGIDSFKFDAGEVNWLPASFWLNGGDNPELWPAMYTAKFAETAAYFGNQIEIKLGHRTQHLPVFVRMLDKGSVWGYENGLKTMVTTLLQMGIAGYPFVLPDMIGGNGYGLRPSRELYIRWLQANVFMPAMQFSFVPWMYDQEVVDHALAMTALHLQYAPTIVDLALAATATGAPINRPIWWVDPTDQTALWIDNEYLLGDDILVAPVLEQGATARDIYLPLGTWRDEADPNQAVYDGPIWLRNYSADLYTVPYFSRFNRQ